TCDRQPDLERRLACRTGLGFTAHRAAVLVNDLARDPQAQAGALALGLGREEWLEDLGYHVGGDPRTVVGHPDHDPRVLDRGRDRDPRAVGRLAGRPVGQRLLGVLDQVCPYLVELVDVDRDARHAAVAAFDDDITQRVMEQRQRGLQAGVYVGVGAHRLLIEV